jgi:hypothetical protein
VLATLLVAIGVDASDRRDRNGNLGAYYDVRAERIFEGFVAGKGHMMDGLMYLPVKTAGIFLEVQLGPKEFVERSTLMFKPRDMVVIVGVPVMLSERRVVLAREISGMNGTLDLRDDQGVRYKIAVRSEGIR